MVCEKVEMGRLQELLSELITNQQKKVTDKTTQPFSHSGANLCPKTTLFKSSPQLKVETNENKNHNESNF